MPDVSATRLQQASPAAVQDINQLLVQLSPNRQPLTVDQLQAILDDVSMFVVRDGTRIAGMACLATATLSGGICGYLEDVVVDQACRSRGFGELLVKAALDYANQSGVVRVDLTTNPSRVSANRLYARLGFQPRQTNVYRYQVK